MSSGPEAGDEHTWSGGDLRNPHVLWSEVMLEEAAAHTFPRAPARVTGRSHFLRAGREGRSSLSSVEVSA